MSSPFQISTSSSGLPYAIRQDICRPSIDLDLVRDYATRLRQRLDICKTPLVRIPAPRTLQATVLVKDEGRQHTGSFKPRIMGPLLSRLERSRTPIARVCSVTTGNQGAAVAWAARRLGLSALIFAPVTATEYKLDRMRGFGAEIVQHADDGSPLLDYQAAERYARQWALSHPGIYLVEHAGSPEIHSYGTLGLELLDQLVGIRAELSTTAVVVPTGAGGLSSGIFSVLKSLDPALTTIAVQTRPTNYLVPSLVRGENTEVASTSGLVEDGINCGALEPEGYRALASATDIALVADERAIPIGLQRLAAYGIRAEGAGALPFVALLQHHWLRNELCARGVTTVVLLNTGRNINPRRYAAFLAPQRSRWTTHSAEALGHPAF